MEIGMSTHMLRARLYSLRQFASEARTSGATHIAWA
jgi:hypothetical protein